MTESMCRDFASRDELIAYLRHEFPEAAAIDNHISPTRGGRKAAEAALHQINPKQYSSSRNYLAGAATQLSPYIRHSVLSMAEVRDYALSQVSSPPEAESLIKELGFRDYFQRVYAQVGDGIWQDREVSKAGWEPADYTSAMPTDVLKGRTGMACMDAFSQQLRETGYLHNHARLWLAAYLIHWRRVAWQAGARWFLTHLLDGDPASNNLSWQWVAGTFSSKPYFFNRENLERFSGGVYCQQCPLYGHCDLEGDYSTLETRLFRPAADQPPIPKAPTPQPLDYENSNDVDLTAPIIWVHGDNLSPHNPAFRAYSSAPAIWVWDEDLLRRWKISLKRIVFIYESLLDLPVVIQRGDPAAVVAAFAAGHQADGVVTSNTPAPRFAAIRRALEQHYPVQVLEAEPFIRYKGRIELKRFSRYWQTAERYAFTPSSA
jgi:deoxyribodipyrimidine photo-lyase